MIRPVSGGGTPPTEFAAHPSAPDALAAQSAATIDTAARSGDPMAKLADLVGAAPHRQFSYVKNGGNGGGTQVRKTDPLVGADLPGQKGVTITRSFGDPKGYDTRNHALAWARAMGSANAMVVLGSDKRWHAVETNQLGKDAKGGTGKVAVAIQVGKVDQTRYDELRKAATEKNDPEKWKDFASYALGIPRDEIEVVTEGKEPSRDKVNINLTRDFDAEGKTAGFDPKKPPWVQLGPLAFDRPANACATLAHEEVHADHHRLTQPLYDQYEKRQPKGKETFGQWVATELDKAARKENDLPKKFDIVRRADIVSGMFDGKFAATELEAHVEAARLAFASGDLVQARTDLNKVGTLKTNPQLQTEKVSVPVLKALRDGLSGDALKVFDDEVKKSRANNVLRNPELKPPH